MKKIQKAGAVLLSAGIISGAAVTIGAPAADASGGCRVYQYEAKRQTRYFAGPTGSKGAPGNWRYIYKGTKIRTTKPFGSNPRTVAMTQYWFNGWADVVASNYHHPYIAKADMNFDKCVKYLH